LIDNTCNSAGVNAADHISGGFDARGPNRSERHVKTKLTTLAGTAALAMALNWAPAAQAKAATVHHAKHARRASVSRDYGSTPAASPTSSGGGPNILDWLDLGPSETAFPGLGLVTDLVEELVGAGGLLTGG
jgi:hypothetical protein